MDVVEVVDSVVVVGDDDIYDIYIYIYDDAKQGPEREKKKEVFLVASFYYVKYFMYSY